MNGMAGRIAYFALQKKMVMHYLKHSSIDMVVWTMLYMHFSPLPPVERTNLYAY